MQKESSKFLNLVKISQGLPPPEQTIEKNFQQIYGFSDQEQSLFQALWQCDQLFKDL